MTKVLVTLVGGSMGFVDMETYLEVTAPSEEVVVDEYNGPMEFGPSEEGYENAEYDAEEWMEPCYPSCVGCDKKMYCEVMGKCLA